LAVGAAAVVHVAEVHVVVADLAEVLRAAGEVSQEAETSQGAAALATWAAVKWRADAPTQVDLLALDKRARGQRAAVNAPMSVAAGLVTSILVGQELEPVHQAQKALRPIATTLPARMS
jgi:hypothetical protein